MPASICTESDLAYAAFRFFTVSGGFVCLFCVWRLGRGRLSIPVARPFTLLGGFTNRLVPIQIGSAEMALPRLNAISFMLLPPSLLLLLSCVHVEVGAGVGWTVYPPHSRRIGIGVDVAIVSLHLSGLSSLAGSINVLTTILLMRGPALAMQRVPLFVWGVLITNLLLLLALDRYSGLTS